MFPNIYARLAANNKMSLADLGKRIGISKKSIYNKMNGKTEFTQGEMVRIQSILGGTLDYLFATDDQSA